MCWMAETAVGSGRGAAPGGSPSRDGRRGGLDFWGGFEAVLGSAAAAPGLAGGSSASERKFPPSLRTLLFSVNFLPPL